ncbi:MAG: tetratricopeptide repeat protein, partial [Bradymonadaceae bacterium]
ERLEPGSELRQRAKLRAEIFEQSRRLGHRDLQADKGVLEKLLERAEKEGWTDYQAIAHHLLGRHTRHIGRAEQAEFHYREAEAKIDAQARPTEAFKISTGVGNLLLTRGRIEPARRALRRALEIADREGFRSYRPMATADLGYLEMVAGRLDRAREIMSEALELTREAGARTLEPRIYNLFGEVCRERGEIEKAREAYQQALKKYAGTEMRRAILPMLNLGLLAALNGRLQQAEGYFWGVSEEADRRKHEMYRAASALGLAYCAAEAGRWSEADERLREARLELADHETVTVDFAKLAEELGESAQSSGRPRLARQAFEIALNQRRQLDHEKR